MYEANRTTPCQQVMRIRADGSRSPLSKECLQNIRWMTATANGTVYLIGGDGLKKISPAGQVTTVAAQLQQRRFPQAYVTAELHYVMGISVDANENVYVAVYGGRQVKKVTPNGRVTVVAETSINWSPTGVLPAPNGDLWVLECSPMNAVRIERITRRVSALFIEPAAGVFPSGAACFLAGIFPACGFRCQSGRQRHFGNGVPD